MLIPTNARRGSTPSRALNRPLPGRSASRPPASLQGLYVGLRNAFLDSQADPASSSLHLQTDQPKLNS